MARVLIVGCGCRGRELAAALVAEGQQVRGTTRAESRLEAIEATGAQAVVADPDRLSTLLPQVEGVSVVCWLAPIYGERLQAFLHRLIDTPVRGFVYEEAGQGAAVRATAAAYRMPVEVVEADPADHATWLAATRAAVERVLSG